MSRNSRDFMFDYNLRMKDAGLVGASAAAQVGGSNKIIDLGTGRVDARAIIDITACEVATGDEKYVLIVQGSSSASFASGIVNLGALPLGDSSVSLESADTGATERREIHFSNEVNGTTYRYVRIYTQVVGTVATGINYTANMVQK